jgi:hypothetical protein
MFAEAIFAKLQATNPRALSNMQAFMNWCKDEFGAAGDALTTDSELQHVMKLWPGLMEKDGRLTVEGLDALLRQSSRNRPPVSAPSSPERDDRDARRREAEETARRQQQEEKIARRRQEEEVRRQQEAEEHARREVEEQARQEAEETAWRQQQEEKMARRREEEKMARRREEEEVRRRREAEERARRDAEAWEQAKRKAGHYLAAAATAAATAAAAAAAALALGLALALALALDSTLQWADHAAAYLIVAYNYGMLFQFPWCSWSSQWRIEFAVCHAAAALFLAEDVLRERYGWPAWITYGTLHLLWRYLIVSAPSHLLRRDE